MIKYQVKIKLQKGGKTDWGREIQDFGSRMLHGLQTFGGSYIGDAIQGVSPKAANVVSKYTAGMISPTPQSYLDKNRKNWLNRASSTADATSAVLAGEMVGAGMNKLASKIANSRLPLSTRTVEKLTPKLQKINEDLGLLLDTKLGKYPNRSKIISNANEELAKGLGIKNKKVPLFLDDIGQGETRTIINNEPTGELDLILSHKPRKISDILLGKAHIPNQGFEGATKPGVSITRNYPYSGTARGSKGMPQPTEEEIMDYVYNSDRIEELFREMYEGRGINGEMIQALKKGAQKEGSPLFMGGNSSPESINKYIKDVAAGRAKLISSENVPLRNRIYEYKKKGGTLTEINKMNWLDKFKDGGKLSEKYIKKARKKPGGSNVGKYNMNQTFAGPSGGAPKGSYPIGDIHHAKSALKLAYHAPNPAGIKAAVYKKYPQLKHQKGGLLTPKEFTLNYIQSPNYKKNLTASGYNVENEIGARLGNVQGISTYGQYGKVDPTKAAQFKAEGRPFTSGGGSTFLPQSNSIIVDFKQAKELGIVPTSIEAHEFGHGEVGSRQTGDQQTSRLNPFDINSITSRLLPTANPIYQKAPDEIKADLNSLKYELFNKGINAGTQTIDLNHLNLLNNSYIKNRLLKNYSPENLIWLLNNLAMNQNQIQNSNIGTDQLYA